MVRYSARRSNAETNDVWRCNQRYEYRIFIFVTTFPAGLSTSIFPESTLSCAFFYDIMTTQTTQVWKAGLIRDGMTALS